MRKLLIGIFSLMLVFGVTGQAMAAYELGNLQLIVYEGGTATAGYEIHVDLGDSAPYSDGTQAGYTLDTGIAVADFESAAGWGDLTAGVIGGFDLDWMTWQYADGVFGSTGDSATGALGFNNASTAMPYIANAGAAPIGKTADGVNTYFKAFNGGGTALGTYNNLLSSIDNEALLGVDGFIDIFAVDAATFATAQVGTLSFDTTGATLVVEYAAVPVPASILLLGSGLLGLVGIRRKKA